MSQSLSAEGGVLNSRTPRIVEITLETQPGADTQERLFAAFEMIFTRCEQEVSDASEPVDKAI